MEISPKDPRYIYFVKLSKKVPAQAAAIFADWIHVYRIKVVISRPRASKYGDYRSPRMAGQHCITVNADLNPYAFSLTFLHEMAHLHTWIKHQNRVKPHGEEWKNEFRKLCDGFFAKVAFPEDVVSAISNYLAQAKSSSCMDEDLVRILKKYDPEEKHQGKVLLEELPHKAYFVLNGHLFIKGEKARKWYSCVSCMNGRTYKVNPMAMVEEFKKEAE